MALIDYVSHFPKIHCIKLFWGYTIYIIAWDYEFETWCKAGKNQQQIREKNSTIGKSISYDW